jgi:hypothetical protein
MSQWGSSDNIFNLQEFYHTIVAMFETDPQHPWVVDTLEWWNEWLFFNLLNCEVLMFYRQVPGLQPATSKRRKQKVSNALERTQPHPLDRIFAQRARRAEDQPPDHDPLGEQRPLPVQPAKPAPIPQPRPIRPTRLAPRSVSPPSQLHPSQHQNGGDPEEDEEGERPDKNNGNDAGDAGDRENELQVEAEDQARRLKAEKEEVARQLRNGKDKSHSTLFRRPSLTITTNAPATSSRDTSSRKRVGSFSYLSCLLSFCS